MEAAELRPVCELGIEKDENGAFRNKLLEEMQVLQEGRPLPFASFVIYLLTFIVVSVGHGKDGTSHRMHLHAVSCSTRINALLKVKQNAVEVGKTSILSVPNFIYVVNFY